MHTSDRPPDGGRAHWPRPRRAAPIGENLAIWHALPGHTWRHVICGITVNAYTHWTGRRTISCIGREYGCTWCGEQVPCYHCYVGAWSPIDGPRRYWRRGRCVVELSPAARLDCPRLALPVDALVGRTLVSMRTGPKLRSRATCGIDDAAPIDPRARVTVDTRGVLLRVWSNGPQACQLEAIQRMLDECATLTIGEE
jgi:hypothetical protein